MIAWMIEVLQILSLRTYILKSILFPSDIKNSSNDNLTICNYNLQFPRLSMESGFFFVTQNISHSLTLKHLTIDFEIFLV